jgi:L-alanine-DL-glutamate epimerase-like enolase superfamily enzyme
MVSRWPRIADLELIVEGCEYERLEPGPEFGEAAHPRNLVQLRGGGAEGLGEDITLVFEPCPPLPLEGAWTLASFCAHLRELDQWTEPPEWGDMARRWRNWAFASAALDLALRQAGVSLHEALGLEPRPTTYVNSLGLGDPPSADTVLRRLERYPGLRFKLDAEPGWTPEIIDALVGTGAVHTVDFKGHYGREIDDEQELLALYDRVLEAFPDTLIEDAHDLPEVAARLEDHVDRIAYDAPIATVADLDATPLPARTFNVKPSRVGHLEELFALYAACEERGFQMYGGGMGELGVARGQIQLLASLFSPDAPNDIAPPGFNALEPPPDMEPSPMAPNPAPIGFRRETY